MGISADDVFVFTDAWNQTATFRQLNDPNDDKLTNLEKRMNYTWRRAFKSMLTTSCTSMVAFLATGFSRLMPISAFGFFSATLIFVNFVYANVSYPCFLILYEKYLINRCKYKGWCKGKFKKLFGCKKTPEKVENDNHIENLYNHQNSSAEGNRHDIEAVENNPKSLNADRVEATIVKSDENNSQKESSSAHGMFLFLIILIGHSTQDNGKNTKMTNSEENEGKSYLKSETRVERFFATHWNTWTNKLKIPILIGALILVSLAIWRASRIEPATEALKWLEDDHPIEKLRQSLQNDYNQGENDEIIEVSIFWGVRGVDRSGTDRWDPTDIGKIIWDDDFDLTPEANQQRVIDICNDLKSNALVKNSQVTCWVQDFVNAQNGGNPVPQADFYTRLNDYITNNSTGIDQFSDNLIGLINGSLRFSVIEAIASADESGGYEKVHPVFEAWEDLKNQYNADSPAGVNKAVQTAKDEWAYLETEREFVRGAIEGIIISMIFGFLVILVSTLNIINAFYSIACIGSIVACVIAVMELDGWSLGIIESVSVVIIIGFSIDYVVHLANHYSESVYDDKFRRMKDSLRSIGISIVAGGITTLGSGFFIFFATVTIFTKFAALIWSTIWFALIFSLVVYSALNHFLGPQYHCGDLKYYIVTPLYEKLKQCCKRKNEKVDDSKEANK